jgi:uncharacterized membrane protein YgcG
MRNYVLIRSTLCLFGLTGVAMPLTAHAQEPPAAVAYQPMDDQQIDSLTARVALYPDAILSDIFVASSYPLEVVEASQWLTAGNTAANVDSQPWDSSVKSLTRFPAVLTQMASNAAWTNDLGAAFLNQQAQVFASVQRLRAQAIAAGTLYSTPQQQVVKDGGVIEIIPANPQTIYVPTYDPQVVYEDQDLPPGTVIQPLVTFDYSSPVGPWLGYDMDWDDDQIYFGDWGSDRPWWHWHDHPDWRYGNYRPGHYDGHAFGHDHGSYTPHEWSHDSHMAGPRFQPLPVIRTDRHIPMDRHEPVPEIDRGAGAERDAQRGRDERARDAAPIRQAPPSRETPILRDTSPVREGPVERPAPPMRDEPARSAPSGGGAMDYGRGNDAARASNRGGASRGGGGGASRGGGGGGGHGGRR